MRCLLPLAAFAILFASCKEPAPKTARPIPSTSTARGVIHGQVIFVGVAPTPRPIDNHTCGPSAKPIVDESVLVSKAGGLKNVVVYLKDTPGPVATSQPTIDQVDCRYVPHVVALQAGQSVRFKSSEPASVAHNVHVASLGINQSITGTGALPPVKLDTPDFVNVRCDVHPWMSCWLAVIDTPYFAVTDDEGRFEIPNVPEGTYTLAAWHERLPPLEQSVTLKHDATDAVTLTYKAP